MEDLVDAVDLMLRAVRKLSGSAEPELEAVGDKVLKQLQQLDLDPELKDARADRLGSVCSEGSRELQGVIRGLADRVDGAFRGPTR